MQFKPRIKAYAKEKQISPQLVLQDYMLERLLERISLSPYRNNFLLKGGFLISAIVGLDTRSTMDLDTTIKGFSLNHESIEVVFKSICSLKVQDDVCFEMLNIHDIRKEDDYPGIRVSLYAKYPPISVPLTVDITTGDEITPKEIEFSVPTLFDNKRINVLAYNLETVLSEKIETILSRGIANTRLRDFYDIYVIYKMRESELNHNVLRQALTKTACKRGSEMNVIHYQERIKAIFESQTLRDLWAKYSREHEYANSISFDQVCSTLETIMKSIV